MPEALEEVNDSTVDTDVPLWHSLPVPRQAHCGSKVAGSLKTEQDGRSPSPRTPPSANFEGDLVSREAVVSLSGRGEGPAGSGGRPGRGRLALDTFPSHLAMSTASPFMERGPEPGAGLPSSTRPKCLTWRGRSPRRQLLLCTGLIVAAQRRAPSPCFAGMSSDGSAFRVIRATKDAWARSGSSVLTERCRMQPGIHMAKSQTHSTPKILRKECLWQAAICRPGPQMQVAQGFRALGSERDARRGEGGRCPRSACSASRLTPLQVKRRLAKPSCFAYLTRVSLLVGKLPRARNARPAHASGERRI